VCTLMIQLMIVDGFDDGDLAKCAKHEVSQAEIERALLNVPTVAPDVAHSDRETRYIGIGRAGDGRPISWRSRSGLWVDGAADPSDQRPLHAPQGGGAICAKCPR
jgi:hypothetical protein